MTRARAHLRFRPAPVAIGLTAGYLASVAFSLVVGRPLGPGAALWTSIGFLTSAIVLLRGPWRTAVVGVCLACHCGLGLWAGDGVATATLVPMMLLTQAMLTAWLALTFCGAGSRRLSLRELILILLAAIVPAAVLAGAIWAALRIVVLAGTGFLSTWWEWAISSALGAAIVLPATLLVARSSQYGDFRRSAFEVLALLGGLCVVTSAVFSQSELPIFFAIFPALTLVAFRLGPAGAAVAGFLVAVIALPLTVLGHGPGMLATALDTGGRIRLTEAFVAAVLFTGVGTAGALAEQSRLRRLMLWRDRVARLARVRARRAEEAVGALEDTAAA